MRLGAKEDRRRPRRVVRAGAFGCDQLTLTTTLTRTLTRTPTRTLMRTLTRTLAWVPMPFVSDLSMKFRPPLARQGKGGSTTTPARDRHVREQVRDHEDDAPLDREHSDRSGRTARCLAPQHLRERRQYAMRAAEYAVPCLDRHAHQERRAEERRTHQALAGDA